jgi:hypothetical protein
MTFGLPFAPGMNVTASTCSFTIWEDGHLRRVYSNQSSVEGMGPNSRSTARSPQSCDPWSGTSLPPIITTIHGLRGRLGRSIRSIHFRTSSEESCQVSRVISSGAPSAPGFSMHSENREAAPIRAVERNPETMSNRKDWQTDSYGKHPLQSACTTWSPSPRAYLTNSSARSVLP